MSVFTNPADGASEAASAYVGAVLGALGRRDAIDVLAGTPATLREEIRGVEESLLRRPEGPARWSVGQVLAHLADSEFVWAWRMRSVLSGDRPPLEGYDQDAWADRLRYFDVAADASLSAFEGARRWNLSLLGRVPDGDLDRVGSHVERGEESLRYMVRLYAGHDLVHLAQIRRILGGHTSTAIQQENAHG